MMPRDAMGRAVVAFAVAVALAVLAVCLWS